MNEWEIARCIKQATPDQRLEIGVRYLGWMFEGARAQGWYQCGNVLLGVCAFAIFILATRGLHNLIAYALLGIGVAVGFVLAIIAFRREREWRRTHPFQIRGDDAQVR